MSIRINCIGEHQTVRYAAGELAKYLSRMTGTDPSVNIGRSDEGINVGLASDLGVEMPRVADPVVDDAVGIDVKGGKGYVAGNNPRSVLLAVYRYLTELGCRWVRPGADGELIPALSGLPDVRLAETPSYRHRGLCIEGAVSVEHVCDTIDWLPKVGMNGYFIQFREGHTFFDRWYAHENNPLMESKPISIDQAREYTAQAVEEIKKRDLLYHGVGHGWTCEPFGISGLGWVKYEGEVPEESVKYLAEVNGKRELWGGIALNTNLCYGNPEARRIVITEIADYAEAHPQIDIMHFWLADGVNNHCECELCRDHRPADLYVRMLNELDELLTSRGLSTRIVFLIYVDLLWPPLEERFANPERFILMFAPITRTYSTPFVGEGSSCDRGWEVAPTASVHRGWKPLLPEFRRNKLEFPKSVDANVAFLRAWQQLFSGDSFDFDYHFMWDHMHDPGYTQTAQIVGLDMRGLRDLGLNGLSSCQVQRAYFPTGLPMTVMARTLWNRDLSFDEIAGDYFESAFGPDGAVCREYMAKLTELFDPVYMRGEKTVVDPEAAERLSRIPDVVREFLPVIERNTSSDNACRAKSWEYLRYHAGVCTLLAKALEARARDDKETALAEWERTKRFVQENEPVLHPVLDVWNFVNVGGWKFRF